MLILLACAPAPDAPAVDTVVDDSSPEETAPVDETAPPVETADTVDTAPPTDTVDTSPPEDTAPVPWRSSFYPEDWTPDFTTADGHFLHDFSYAGYQMGAVPLPTPPGDSFDVTTYGADNTGAADSTAAIQAAIDAASAAAPAVVYLPAGTYRVDGTLNVSTSGVVVQGEGSDLSFLYFTLGDGMAYATHLSFTGSVAEGEDLPLSTDGVSRSMSVTLADASSVAVGDEVHLGWTITDDFITDHDMTDVWTEFNGDWRAFFRRTVVAVDSSTGEVTLDVPLRYDAKVRDGASLRVVTGQLSEVGLQDLAVSTVNDFDIAWAESQAQAVLFSGVKDGWISNVVTWESPLSTDGLGKHLMSNGILVLDSRRVTIADTVMEKSQNRGEGGNGYLFQVSRSNEVLTVDSVGREGRHNFIQNWDFGTSGCVWLRTTSEDGRSYLADWDPIGYTSYSEFHHSLAMANLIDQSVATDGWQAVNRQTQSSGAGHAATQSVWWNLTGSGYLRSLQFGDGYVIGVDGMDVHVDPDEWDWNSAGHATEPQDQVEGEGAATTLEPQSLYEDQLTRRLGG